MNNDQPNVPSPNQTLEELRKIRDDLLLAHQLADQELLRQVIRRERLKAEVQKCLSTAKPTPEEDKP